MKEHLTKMLAQINAVDKENISPEKLVSIVCGPN